MTANLSSNVLTLEENPSDVYLESTTVLLKIASNILKFPTNEKYRSIRLGNTIVVDKLLPVAGALECLFEMGFEEGEDNLYLPKNASLSQVKKVHDEILSRRSRLQNQTESKKSKNEPVSKSTGSALQSPIAPSTSVQPRLPERASFTFLNRVIQRSKDVLVYENLKLQKKALDLIPLISLQLNVERNIRSLQLSIKTKKVEEQEIDFQEFLLIELLNWFKNDFFKWVDVPECNTCGTNNSVQSSNRSIVARGMDRVEVYSCSKCHADVFFPRYNDPEKLLVTRKGRCGEWANCFTLFCRALGWEARHVIDETDHVWTEVFLKLKNRWVHCDPCENILDAPLLYECGWKKQLSYIIGYSCDDVQDVTWRYSAAHPELLKRRNKCTEQELIEVMFKIREARQKNLSSTRKSYLMKRNLLELVELMKQHKASEAELQGRVSGSLAWRMTRGEISLNSVSQYVWDITPQSNNRIDISYSAKDDIYKLNSEVVIGWENGVYEMESIKRKVEHDWKMVYLSRSDGVPVGKISWKFQIKGEAVAIDKIQVKVVSQVYESGVVTCSLCSGEVCIPVKNADMFETDVFSGTSFIVLTAELSGGNGQEAWQHAQLFRESMSSVDDVPFQLSFTFKNVP